MPFIDACCGAAGFGVQAFYQVRPALLNILKISTPHN
jgi:hypothetical protein